MCHWVAYYLKIIKNHKSSDSYQLVSIQCRELQIRKIVFLFRFFVHLYFWRNNSDFIFIWNFVNNTKVLLNFSVIKTSIFFAALNISWYLMFKTLWNMNNPWTIWHKLLNICMHMHTEFIILFVSLAFSTKA